MPDATTFHWHCSTVADTERLAAQLAALVRVGDVIALHGELGAGKTVFARAFIHALPGGKGLDVSSPTFTLLQSYDTAVPVWHYDLYRVERPDELYELGFEEAFDTAITLIEWPDRAAPLLPRQHLAVHIDFVHGAVAKAEQRTCTLQVPRTLLERFTTLRGQPLLPEPED